jgi:ribonuclease D
MYVDKTEQCSDWQRRPLTSSQAAYAAADAHCLTVLFDRSTPNLGFRV